MKTCISIDVGRSSVKCLCKGKSYCFPTVIASNPGDSGLVQIDLDKVRDQVTILDKTDFKGSYLLGRTALKSTNTFTLDFTEGTTFHRYSVPIILYSVARMLYETGMHQKKPEVVLAINLTYNNHSNTDMYSKALKGKHELTINAEGKDTLVKFEVVRLFCFYQGYVSSFNYLSAGHLSDTLCIDVGSYTLDLSLVRDFSLVRGASFNLGTSVLKTSIIEEAAKHKITLTSQICDDLLMTRQTLKTVTGNSFNINNHLSCKTNTVLKSYLEQVVTVVLNFIGDNPVTQILLVGGGANLLQEGIKQKFSVPFLKVEDPVYSNVKGMDKFITECLGAQ